MHPNSVDAVIGTGWRGCGDVALLTRFVYLNLTRGIFVNVLKMSLKTIAQTQVRLKTRKSTARDDMHVHVYNR